MEQITLPLTGLEKTKAAGVLDAPATALKNTTNNQYSITKNQAMLSAFIRAGRHGLNRFQAYLNHHDSVLNSTIPVLQKKYGLCFSREWERVTNFTGGKTSVMRYWLDEENIAKAIEALEAEESRYE